MCKKIVVACSGGPDSMALLDILYKEDKSIVVCHVNYKKRETADRDEKLLKEYCQKRGILVEVLYPVKSDKSNFQSWARQVRYDFFFEVAHKYDAQEIYVAHQLDDHIETYLFQIQRNMLCEHYGLNPCSERDDFKIVRPLLKYPKKELEEYCQKNHIQYGIDESNLRDDYTRNQIRHEKIDKMNMEQKLDLVKEIDQKNEILSSKRRSAIKFLDEWKKDITSLLKQEDAWFILEYYLSLNTNAHYSKKHMLSLLLQLQSDCMIDLDGFDLESFKGNLYLKRKETISPVILDKLGYAEYKNFRLTNSGKKIESLYVEEKDFPITIRPYQPGDHIELRYGTKKLSRFFIDRKIPKIYRKTWLVIENCDRKVIFVHGIGCDVKHFSIKPNLFMIQYLT